MKKKIIMLLGLIAFVSEGAEARKKQARNASNVNVRGTLTSINATVEDTTKTSVDYTSIAPVTDAIAKRKCTDMVADALNTYCSNNSCRNATEAFAKISLSTTTDRPNETYCANFIEEAVNNLWDSYDEYASKKEVNCNIALARSLAAEECYRQVLVYQRETAFVKIPGDKLEGLCGVGAIKEQYKKLEKKYSSDDITDDKLGGSLVGYFQDVGSFGWNLLEFTRFADLNFVAKTDEFPRELIQLVNSLKSQGNLMCGEERYAELYDTNIQLLDKSSSIQRRVREEGLIKGGIDWVKDQYNGVADLFRGDKKDEKKNESENRQIGQNGGGEKSGLCGSGEYWVEGKCVSHTELANTPPTDNGGNDSPVASDAATPPDDNGENGDSGQ